MTETPDDEWLKDPVRPVIEVNQTCTTCGAGMRMALDLGPWNDPFSSTVRGQLYCSVDPTHRVEP